MEEEKKCSVARPTYQELKRRRSAFVEEIEERNKRISSLENALSTMTIKVVEQKEEIDKFETKVTSLEYELSKANRLLQILKERRVAIERVKLRKDYRKYNDAINAPALCLTEYEFNLIKEWLTKEK